MSIIVFGRFAVVAEGVDDWDCLFSVVFAVVVVDMVVASPGGW
jgi:hypothetical protein